MSLKKGGADENVPKALRYLLATAQEVKEVEEQSQTTGQWLADILEYRRMPTPMTPFDYITLSDATELKVQEVRSQTANVPLVCMLCMSLRQQRLGRRSAVTEAGQVASKSLVLIQHEASMVYTSGCLLSTCDILRDKIQRYIVCQCCPL